MHASRVLCVAAAVACLLSTAAAFVSGGGNAVLRTRAATSAGQQQHVQPVQQQGVQALRASEDGGEEGGFVNPYTAFRKWQMDLVSSSVLGAFLLRCITGSGMLPAGSSQHATRVL